MNLAERQVNRREALVGSALVGAGALAVLVSACGPASTIATSPSSRLEGTWRQDVTLDDGTKHQALMLCTKDGGVGVTASLQSNSFGTGFGAWSQTGDQYLITFEVFVITAGTFDSRLRVHAAPKIDPSGDQMTARVKFDVQPAGATGFIQGGGATWNCSRIKPMAL